jgi:hypothetical protein
MIAVHTFFTVVGIYGLDCYVKSLRTVEGRDYFDSCYFGPVGTGH